MAEKAPEVKYQELPHGGRVARLKAWPKPILGRDGQPKQRKAKAAPKAEEKSAEEDKPKPVTGSGGVSVSAGKK